MVLYFNSLVLPAVAGHAEPATIRGPTPSLRPPAASPPPPPPRVSNAAHRAAGGGGWAAGRERRDPGGFAGWISRRNAGAGATPQAAARPPAAVGRGAALRAPLRALRTAGQPPGAELLPRAAVSSPQRCAWRRSWPGRCRSAECQATNQSSSFIYLFFFFLSFSFSPHSCGQCS